MSKQPIRGSLPSENKTSGTTNKIVIIVVLITGSLGLLAFLGVFSQNDYPLDSVTFNFNYTNGKCNITNAYLNSVVTLHTTSFSAQNPIDVDIRLNIPAHDGPLNYDWSCMPDHFTVVFENAYDYNVWFFPTNGVRGNAFIMLHKQDDHYERKGTIIYSFDKEYGYYYLTQNETEKLDRQETFFTDNKYIEKQEQFTHFMIGSSDQTATSFSNRIFVALTLVLVAFGVVESRDKIDDIIRWYDERSSELSL